MKAESKGHVLVVDDEPDVVKAFARILASAGFTVDTAPDGEQALALARQRSYDAVLADVTMPRLDGIGLLHALHEHDHLLPVVLVSASPSLDAAMKALEYGALRYLTKPVEMARLIEVAGTAVAHGRAQRQAAPPSPVAAEGADHALGGQFDRALEQLWMAYQPIVRWTSREVVAYEALVRSREPTMPHPGLLLEAAEKLGRTFELGRAARAAATRPLAGAAPEALLFVNLHTAELEDDALLAPDAPLTPFARRTVLEITERASLEEIKDVHARVKALRELGFRIAVDDIGAGYSGLNSLALLEPDVIKIDMTLVRDVHLTPTKQKLVRSMVALGDSLGVLVVAEGVENAAELKVLVDLGCDHFQGYFFARPDQPFPQVRWPAPLAA